jgi:hypothetical protein
MPVSGTFRVESHPNVAKNATLGWGAPARRKPQIPFVLGFAYGRLGMTSDVLAPCVRCMSPCVC